MKINIIARDNAAGLTADIDILTKLLSGCGFEIDFTDYKSLKRFAPWLHKTHDLNIFLQWADPSWLRLAKKNILIPNPEWFKEKWLPYLNRFNGIFCKTKHAVEIFKDRNPNVVFTSFTSRDKSIKDKSFGTIKKEYNQYLHVAGKSKMKGTDIIIKTWIKNPDFPHLTVIQRNIDPLAIPARKNLTIISKYISDDQLRLLMNRCGVHICTSSAEGFGHSICESLSCKALIISTDAPPMNELVRPDRGILIKPVKKEKKKLSHAFFIDVSDLEKTVKKLMKTNNADKDILMQNAYKFYIENDNYFRKTMINAIDNISNRQP